MDADDPMDWRELDELADLIVEGRGEEAYAILRDHNPLLPSYEGRKRILAARAAPDRDPVQTEAQIDARHDRAMAMFPQSKSVLR